MLQLKLFKLLTFNTWIEFYQHTPNPTKGQKALKEYQVLMSNTSEFRKSFTMHHSFKEVKHGGLIIYSIYFAVILRVHSCFVFF